MILVNSLKAIITHRTIELFDSNPNSPLKSLVMWGELSMKGFQELIQKNLQNGNFTEEEIKTFLVELELGFKMRCIGDDESLFIPSLICDKKEITMKKRIHEMKAKAKPDCHKFVYLIPKTMSLNLFQMCLTKMVSSNNKIVFKEGFSQKIEHRNTNSELSAVFGHIELDGTDIEFLFAEVERCPTQEFYSTQKVKVFEISK